MPACTDGARLLGAVLVTALHVRCPQGLGDPYPRRHPPTRARCGARASETSAALSLPRPLPSTLLRTRCATGSSASTPLSRPAAARARALTAGRSQADPPALLRGKGTQWGPSLLTRGRGTEGGSSPRAPPDHPARRQRRPGRGPDVTQPPLTRAAAPRRAAAVPGNRPLGLPHHGQLCGGVHQGGEPWGRRGHFRRRLRADRGRVLRRGRHPRAVEEPARQGRGPGAPRSRRCRPRGHRRGERGSPGRLRSRHLPRRSRLVPHAPDSPHRAQLARWPARAANTPSRQGEAFTPPGGAPRSEVAAMRGGKHAGCAPHYSASPSAPSSSASLSISWNSVSSLSASTK